MNNIKNVCILMNTPSPYRVDFFKYLNKRFKEYSFHILYSSKNESNRLWKIPKESFVSSAFLKSKTIRIRKGYDYKYIHIPFGVFSSLTKIHPDVVVIFEYNPTSILSAIWCRKNKVPYVSWTDGTLNSERNINFIQKFMRHNIIKAAKAYIGSSTSSREAQIYYGAEPAACFISNLTVDIDKYTKVKEETDGHTILFVGQLIERKGLDLLLNVLAGIKKPWRLIVAGNGPKEEEYRNLAQELKIVDNIEFCGFLQREELQNKYMESDVFVLPTREDCYGLVILEAMCAGIPVVVSKYADGANDLVVSGKNGYVIDPYKREELSSALEKILKDKELRIDMGNNSYEMSRQFDFENVSVGFIQALKTALGKET